jgi:hypothetical protein
MIPNWVEGKVKRPTMQNINLLCRAYDLSSAEVRALVTQRQYRRVDASVSDLKSLVQWLAKEHHDGTYLAIAGRVGVAKALPYQWRDGLVSELSPEVFDKLCEAYNLDPSDVNARISKPR